MKPSRCKSTQHPDNVHSPFFSERDVVGGDDEIKEAFYAFSHLGCHEQLWDAEGKEIDNFVVKKLLTRYEPFFRSHVLGDRYRLSLRVPNPRVEKTEGKILLEALYSLTRSYDICKVFYGKDAPAPIIDVYVPMVESAEDVLRIRDFYREYIINEQERKVHDIAIKDWLGTFGPPDIHVIPLVEDKESILRSDDIAREIIRETGQDEIRFWYARSDPALNYGNAATVLMLKIALQRLHKVEQETGVVIYPSLGCGSAPFRGNLRPDNVRTILQGYPSVQTFTLQSSFKYDHPIGEVQKAVRILNETQRSEPMNVDEQKLLPIIEKLSQAYEEEVRLVAPLVNEISPFVPGRRLRKLHVGLFGYARESKGVKLPRAIKFTASLYSLGLPPELLGLSVLSDEEVDVMKEAWANFESDYRDAAQYCNPDTLNLFPDMIADRVRSVLERFPIEPERRHRKITGIIRKNFDDGNHSILTEDIVRAAAIRKFLG